MPSNTPLSTETMTAGHRLYQVLYGPVSEGVRLTIAQVQAEIDLLTSQEIPRRDLIRAAMAQADYRFREAYDDERSQTAEDAIAEPAGRMNANADVVSLLQDTQIEYWNVQAAQWDAEDALRAASL